jgi:hypothetical protein
MKNLWLALLERAIRALIDVDWMVLQTRVVLLWNSPASGDEKHRLIFDEMRAAGSELASWMLDIAIKAAYGKVKSELENTK